jgi:hypothetical protein
MSSSLFAFLTNLRMLLVKFEDWLVEPLDTLAKHTSSVEDNLHTLKSHCSGLQSAVGHPVSIANQEFPDVWCAIEFLSSSFNTELSLEDVHKSLHELAVNLDSLQVASTKLSQKFDTLHDLRPMLDKHEARFKAIHPVLTSVKDILQCLTSLEVQVGSGVTFVRRSTPSDPWLLHLGAVGAVPDAHVNVIMPTSSPKADGSGDTVAWLTTLEHTVKSLEKRIVGDGIRIGRFLFQSKEDLRVWQVSHVPGNYFGLFLDGVSIFDFLAQPHMDSQENMAHLYNLQKNGFDIVYESRIISSMQNIFPNLFGKTNSDGMDTAQTLPSLQSADKWSSNGVTGLQLQVERELPNVDLQFRNAIATVFEDSPEARDLALELLYRSKKLHWTFVILYKGTLSSGLTRSTPRRKLGNLHALVYGELLRTFMWCGSLGGTAEISRTRLCNFTLSFDYG